MIVAVVMIVFALWHPAYFDCTEDSLLLGGLFLVYTIRTLSSTERSDQ